MMYAIPSQNLHVGNHFSRSPQIVIMDDRQQVRHIIPWNESKSPCNKKKQWMAIIGTYNVKAVVVRNIGKKMLEHLFHKEIKVFGSPAKALITELDLKNLPEVRDTEYGRESRNKHRCGSKSGQTSAHSTSSTLFSAEPHKLGIIRRVCR
ncbi:NifB/NifX family molybdenum-iron cluster-binding protein [Vibrio sp. 99-70-13A1]|uniref:NifB/NifX family molybdenum-iron cluster-binding protein n=1 Tax=Vibrio sp. 99-70-13A1 TaxID=2607601 RepID=UPI00149367CD|nr:NifB/NifX family molybdenum-iron cluster-binding protein [Vibrio sp. 99-70-13A1]NOH95778.1 hypothetical protein [Vibrio sp. 99-70-13A1]